MTKRTALALLTAAVLTAAPTATAAPPGPELDWRTSVTDSDQNLRGLDAVSASEAWVSGESRSGGAAGIFHTDDGGRTWEVLPDTGMVPTEGEAQFSASGDCLTVSADRAHIVTGGASSRVLTSTDHGLTWTARDSALRAGDAAGAFAASFTGRHGIVVGGDFDDPANTRQTTARSHAGGAWRSGEDLTHVGEDVAHVRGSRLALATGDYRGSEGTSLTRDGGKSCERVTDQGFHTLDCTPGGTCWGAGSEGMVGTLRS